MQTASKKVINGWAMYDWANSVYSLVITSTIFPAYYESVTKNNANSQIIFIGRKFVNSALYNYALGVGFFDCSDHVAGLVIHCGLQRQ